MEISYYIIKPEAVHLSDEIQKKIISSGLTISKSTKILLPTTIIEKLYSDCSKNIIEASKFFMCNEVCEVGIVIGSNALKKLITISGTDTNPNLCNVGTIRNQFGVKEPQYFKGIRYYKNAIHRPTAKREVKQDIALIEGLLKF